MDEVAGTAPVDVPVDRRDPQPAWRATAGAAWAATSGRTLADQAATLRGAPEELEALDFIEALMADDPELWDG